MGEEVGQEQGREGEGDHGATPLHPRVAGPPLDSRAAGTPPPPSIGPGPTRHLRAPPVPFPPCPCCSRHSKWGHERNYAQKGMLELSPFFHRHMQPPQEAATIALRRNASAAGTV
jgi:hypothetical protein